MPVKYAPRVVSLVQPSMHHEAAFFEAVARSRRVHGRFVHPPSTRENYESWMRRVGTPTHLAHLVQTEDGELAGVINVSEVVRGAFLSAYLGYYAFAPYAGKGYMRAGLIAVIARAFGEYGLHRLEANIQPGNAKSIALASGVGFRLEGYSPRYLKIAGRWRDHERWALTTEDRKPRLKKAR